MTRDTSPSSGSSSPARQPRRQSRRSRNSRPQADAQPAELSQSLLEAVGQISTKEKVALLTQKADKKLLTRDAENEAEVESGEIVKEEKHRRRHYKEKKRRAVSSSMSTEEDEPRRRRKEEKTKRKGRRHRSPSSSDSSGHRRYKKDESEEERSRRNRRRHRHKRSMSRDEPKGKLRRRDYPSSDSEETVEKRHRGGRSKRRSPSHSSGASRDRPSRSRHSRREYDSQKSRTHRRRRDHSDDSSSPDSYRRSSQAYSRSRRSPQPDRRFQMDRYSTTERSRPRSPPHQSQTRFSPSHQSSRYGDRLNGRYDGDKRSQSRYLSIDEDRAILPPPPLHHDSYYDSSLPAQQFGQRGPSYERHDDDDLGSCSKRVDCPTQFPRDGDRSSSFRDQDIARRSPVPSQPTSIRQSAPQYGRFRGDAGVDPRSRSRQSPAGRRRTSHSSSSDGERNNGVQKTTQMLLAERAPKPKEPEVQFAVCHNRMHKGNFQLYVCGDCPELGGSTEPGQVKDRGIPMEPTDSKKHFETDFVRITSKEVGETISYLYYVIDPTNGAVRDVENLASNKATQRGCRTFKVPRPAPPFGDDQRRFCVSDRQFKDLSKQAEIKLATIIHGSWDEPDI